MLKFCQGDKVFDIIKNKFGVIVELKNNLYENKYYETNIFYYHVDWNDGESDLYVCSNNLIYAEEQNNKLNINQNQNQNTIYNNYKSGQRFINMQSNKSGIIRNLRNDEYEKKSRISDPFHHYYNVDYDDGSFETYANGKYLKLI